MFLLDEQHCSEIYIYKMKKHTLIRKKELD